MILHFWSFNVKSNLYPYISFLLVLASYLVESWNNLNSQSRIIERFKATFWTLGKYFLAFILIFLSDIPSLLSSNPLHNSYMSSSALCIALIALLFHSLKMAIATISNQSKHKVLLVSLFSLAIFGIFRSQYTVQNHFSVPLSLEYRLVRNEIRNYVSKGESLCGIRFIRDSFPSPPSPPSPPILETGYGEFNWSNINNLFYITRMLENVLDELNLSRVRIDVLSPSTNETVTSPDYIDWDFECPPLVIDVENLNLK